jgi:hypothetical protein
MTAIENASVTASILASEADGLSAKKRSGGSSVPRASMRRSREGGAGVRRRVSRHGMGAVAPGCSESGGQCMSHGRSGRAANMGDGGRERRGRNG